MARFVFSSSGHPLKRLWRRTLKEKKVGLRQGLREPTAIILSSALTASRFISSFSFVSSSNTHITMSLDQLPDDHFRPTYEEIHVQIGEAARRIKGEFDPDLMVAIGGGGFYPARVLRTFLKKPSALDPSKMRNIPIQAIGLSLYEEVSGTAEGQIGNEVVRTQWLDAKTVTGHKGPGKIEEGKDAGGLLGKNVLIVDEVDDSRTTLQYAYSELLKDVKNAIANLSAEERANLAPTRFAIFVVHNKEKAGGKRGTLPILPKQLAKGEDKIVEGVSEGVRYYSTQDIGDVWICYPWEEEDIVEHNRLAALAKKLGVNQPN